MEEVGASSKCFQSSLRRSSSDSADLRPTCYKVVGCSSTSVTLSIGGVKVQCPVEGGEIEVDAFKGTLICPPSSQLCQLLQDQCSGNGVLLATGACECFLGRVGDDCSGFEYPSNDGGECGGSTHGACDRTSGLCECSSGYTGVSCSEVLCPIGEDSKNSSQCSGNGVCDVDSGACKCRDGYSGAACECVAGCTSSSCGVNGECSCESGACSCSPGFSGVGCLDATAPEISELTGAGRSVTIGSKQYQFFKGSLGVFPRAINALGRFCSKPTEAYAQAAPGYFYLSLLGFSTGTSVVTLRVETEKCRGVTCSGRGTCGRNVHGVCSCD